MERSRFSEAQIAFVLRQAEEGAAVGEVCRKAGISEATFYNWRKRYGGMMPSEVRRLRQLEEENGKAEEARRRSQPGQGHAAGCARKKALRPVRRRELIDEIRATWKVSIRRTCAVLRAERSSYHYKGRRRGQATLAKRIREICETRVRYGYRRVHVLLRREGWEVNAKRVYRIYRQLGLQLRNKTPKRRVKAKL